ncbi:MAG: hypothetical protein WBN04_21395 [Paracoccaceae bacterium]
MRFVRNTGHVPVSKKQSSANHCLATALISQDVKKPGRLGKSSAIMFQEPNKIAEQLIADNLRRAFATHRAPDLPHRLAALLDRLAKSEAGEPEGRTAQ